jgi:cytolysin (calcineurin-like family phosphatase)
MNMTRSQDHRSRAASFRPSFALFALVATVTSLTAADVVPKQTDATFLFTADVHQTFDGTTDSRGFVQSTNDLKLPTYYLLFIANETAADLGLINSHEGCTIHNSPSNLEFVMDLCNGIQHVRKMRALTSNTWPADTFDLSGLKRSFLSQGNFATPLGLIAGGDLTDCAGGHPGGANCVGYSDSGGVDSQLTAFRSIYDNSAARTIDFNRMAFLPGLTLPNNDTPLNIPVFPGLGNHDIDSPGSPNLIRNYVNSLVVTRQILPLPGTVIRNWNPSTTAYSWDWGKLHVVNVGVYPGSANDYTNDVDYQFSEDSLAWLIQDLRTFAGDGRPVVIASHFGFDAFSLKPDWWGSGGVRSQGSARIFWALKDFNVVGYYSGHVHNQDGWISTSRSSFLHADKIDAPLPRIGYDTFVPGPGFAQNFAATRVTDSRMDVTLTKDSSDFDYVTKQIELNHHFTKMLMPPPVPDGALDNVLPGSTQTLGFRAFNRFHLLGVNAQGQYSIVRFDSRQSYTSIAQGTFADPVNGIASYQSTDGVHIVIHTEKKKFIDYLFSASGLTLQWNADGGASSFMIAPAAGAYWLLADNTAAIGVVDIYKISPTGLVYNRSNATTGMSAAAAQIQSFGAAIDSPTTNFIYFNPDSGAASFWVVNWDLGTLQKKGAESWAPGGMRVLNLPYGDSKVLLATPYCLPESFLTGLFCTPNTDSPVYILSLITDMNGNVGTDVSWRGLPQGPWPGVTVRDVQDSFEDADPDSGFGVFSRFSNGSVGHLSITSAATTQLTLVPTVPASSAMLNGTPVTLPATVGIVPGRTYTVVAPDTVSPSAGVMRSNPSWTAGTPVGQNGTYTFTAPETPVTLTLNYGATSYLVSTSANPPAGGTVSGAGWKAAGSMAQISAVPNTGYTFAAFSGAAESPNNPTSVAVNFPIGIVADFSTGTGPSAYVTTNGPRTDGPEPDQRIIPVAIVNRNGSGIGTIRIMAASSPQVQVLAIQPQVLGDLPPNGSIRFTILASWPATVSRASITINFSGNAGQYVGTSTLTLNR